MGELKLGVLGELHPLVREHYELPAAPLLAADLNLDSLLAQSRRATRCSRSRLPAGSGRPGCDRG